MDAQKVDMFIMANSRNLPETEIPLVRDRLLSLDESRWAALTEVKFKSTTTALVISLFLRCYGIDRFYLGETGKGVGKLLTCGGLGIWAIVDWFLISAATRKLNYNKLQAYLH